MPSECSNSKGEGRRAAILQLAAGHFIENGYAETTMSEIADALGGSKSTLWNYFPSKDSLFLNVIDGLTADFRHKISNIIINRPKEGFFVKDIYRNIFSELCSVGHINLLRAVMSGVAKFPEIGRLYYQRVPYHAQKIIEQCIDEIVRPEWMGPIPSSVVAEQLIGLCISGPCQSRLLGLTEAMTSDQINIEVDLALEIIVRAYPIDILKKSTGIFSLHGKGD